MKSRFYAVRVTVGQESNVAKVASLRISAEKIPIKSILIPPDLKGVLIVESDNVSMINQVFSGMRHVKKIVFGTISLNEVRRLIEKREIEEEFMEGDIVEVSSGPFRDMRAKITRVDMDKREAVIEFLDASFTLPVTISIDMLRLIRRKGEE